MAGTSGRIPDHDVNFFGQLCKPAPRPSTTTTTTEPNPQAANDPTTEAPPPTTAKQAPAPDHIHELFAANQDLIRGLSLGNVETYLATVKGIFADVRRGRCGEVAPRREGEERDRAGFRGGKAGEQKVLDREVECHRKQDHNETNGAGMRYLEPSVFQ